MSKAKKKSASVASVAEASMQGVDDPSMHGRKVRGKASEGDSGEKRPRDTRSDNPPTAAKKGMPGSRDPARRCIAKANRTGERCRAAAIKGGTVCRIHGGGAPQVKKAAKERLLELVEPALAELRKIVMNPKTDDSVKVRSIQIILDRTGYGPGQTVILQSSAWDDATDALLNGMIDANNGNLPVSRDMSSLPHDGGVERPTVKFDWPDVIDGEVIEDESTDNRDQFTEPSIPVSERTGPAKSGAYATNNGHPIWGDDGVKPNSGASEYDPTPSGPYEPGLPTYEERLARDLQEGLPPRNQRRQR